MKGDRRLIRTQHSLRGETRYTETRSPDSVISLREHPLRRGIHMDMVYGEIDGLGCWSLNAETGFVASVEPLRDYVLLHWMRAGQINFQTRRRHEAFSAGSAFLWSAAELHQVEHAPCSDFVVATVRHDDIRQFACRLIGQDLTDQVKFGAVPPGTPNEQGLRFVLSTLAGAVLDDDRLAGAPLALAALKDMVLGALVELCPNTIGKRPLAGCCEPQPVARAQEFMRSHMSRPIRVTEIAEASGVPLRSLQIAFRKATGQSLVEHLRTMRMERVRADLMDPSCPHLVSTIAYRWGFTHPSDFSRRYVEAFGELPRTTLLRHRPASP